MTAISVIPKQTLFTYRWDNSNSSKEEFQLTQIKNKIDEVSTKSVTGERSQLIQEFNEMLHECSIEDWDGYGALPLTLQAVKEAARFIDLLPIEVPDPDTAALPNGDVGFQWTFGRDRILTISFSGGNILLYASILGSPDRTKNGSEIFDDCIPKEVFEAIAEIRP